MSMSTGPKISSGTSKVCGSCRSWSLGLFMNAWNVSPPFGNPVGGKLKNLARFWRAESTVLCSVYFCFCFQLHSSNHSHAKMLFITITKQALKTYVAFRVVSPPSFLLQLKTQTLKHNFAKATNLHAHREMRCGGRFSKSYFSCHFKTSSLSQQRGKS